MIPRFGDFMIWWFGNSVIQSFDRSDIFFYSIYIFFVSLKYKILCKTDHCRWLNRIFHIFLVYKLVKNQSNVMMAYIDRAFFNENIK